MAQQDPWIFRLQKEHQMLQEYCSNSDVIRFEVADQKYNLPPTEYLIHYQLRSLVGVDVEGKPQYGNHHTARISIPTTYPLLSGPICCMESTIWHPNIRHKGVHKGRICINTPAMGFWHTLDMLVAYIGVMLQYKNYHALPIPPYPEDMEVAEWVRTVGEPQKIVHKELGIYTDNQALHSEHSLTEAAASIGSQKVSSKIKIIQHAP